MPIDPNLLAARNQGLGNYTREELDELNNSMELAAAWLDAVKFPRSVDDFIRNYARSNNRRRPSVEDIRASLPHYPVYLHVQTKVNLRDTAGLGQLLGEKDLAKLPFIRQFCQSRELYGHEIGPRAVVQLVKWPSAGVMVLHNAGHGLEPDVGDRFFRLVIDQNATERKTRRKADKAEDTEVRVPKPAVIMIEPLRQFVNRYQGRLSIAETAV